MPRAVVSSIVGNPRERCSIRGPSATVVQARGPQSLGFGNLDNELPPGLFRVGRGVRSGVRGSTGPQRARAKLARPGASGVT